MGTKEQLENTLSTNSGLEITEEAKRRVAYALNMCTVSVASSCALEHVDLLLSVGSYNRDKILRLISTAVKMSGNAFDIIELCAIAYLKINEQDEAVNLLRILVNEDYNRIINAQLIKRINALMFES